MATAAAEAVELQQQCAFAHGENAWLSPALTLLGIASVLDFCDKSLTRKVAKPSAGADQEAAAKAVLVAIRSKDTAKTLCPDAKEGDQVDTLISLSAYVAQCEPQARLDKAGVVRPKASSSSDQEKKALTEQQKKDEWKALEATLITNVTSLRRGSPELLPHQLSYSESAMKIYQMLVETVKSGCSVPGAAINKTYNRSFVLLEPKELRPQNPAPPTSMPPWASDSKDAQLPTLHEQIFSLCHIYAIVGASTRFAEDVKTNMGDAEKVTVNGTKISVLCTWEAATTFFSLLTRLAAEVKKSKEAEWIRLVQNAVNTATGQRNTLTFALNSLMREPEKLTPDSYVGGRGEAPFKGSPNPTKSPSTTDELSDLKALLKRAVCRDWVQDNCPRGKDCKLYHHPSLEKVCTSGGKRKFKMYDQIDRERDSRGGKGHYGGGKGYGNQYGHQQFAGGYGNQYNNGYNNSGAPPPPAGRP